MNLNLYDKQYIEQYKNIFSLKKLKEIDKDFGSYCENILLQQSILNNNLHNLIFCLLNDLDIHKKCKICGKQLTINAIKNKRYYCSKQCAYKDTQRLEKIKQTCLQKYGTNSFLESETAKKKLKQKIQSDPLFYQKCANKRKQTNLQKYGVENPSQLKIINQKRKQTCFKKYGKITNLLNEENIQKIKQTNLEKYGCEYQINSSQTQQKIKQTNLQKYGVDNVFKSKEIQQKIKQTNLQKYGAEFSSTSKQIKEKRFKTNLKKYGVDNVFKSKEIQQKIKQTNLEKYGVDNVFKSKEIQQKIKQTNLQKYGAEYVVQSQKIRKKIQNVQNKKSIEHIKLWKDFIQPHFDLNTFSGWNQNYQWLCTKCGNIFSQQYKQTFINTKFQMMPRCPNCYPYSTGQSIIELQVLNFIKSIYFDQIIQNNRTIIKPLELDIVLPELKLAIEFNGSYWHSNKQDRIDQNYHLNKTIECQKNGYRLIHIFEYEWMNKQQIIKNKLKSIICNNEPSIYARKCIIKQIDTKDKNQFLNNNHIQSEDNSSIKLGLFYQNELVAVMTFSKPRFNKNYQWQLSRYATSKRVIGGAGKLLKYFEQNYKPKSIITYADRRYSIGNMYYKLGFKLDHISKPNYVWCKGNQILSRYQTQKHKLKKVLGNKFNQNLSESENMYFNGWNKIYDCGNYVFIKELLIYVNI